MNARIPWREMLGLSSLALAGYTFLRRGYPNPRATKLPGAGAASNQSLRMILSTSGTLDFDLTCASFRSCRVPPVLYSTNRIRKVTR